MNSQITFQPDKQFVAPKEEARRARFMKHVKGLAISEIVSGLLCAVLEIALLSVAAPKKHYLVYYGSYSFYYSRPLFGVGLWCGAWICFAGISGIVAANHKISNSRIYIHMGFCWLGILFSILLFSFSIGFAVSDSYPQNSLTIFQIIMYSFESVLGFVCTGLHIASFVISLILVRCCKTCCCVQPTDNLIYPGNTGFVQQPGFHQPGHSGQSYGQPSLQYSSSVQMTPGLPGPQPAPNQPGLHSYVS